MLGNAGVVAAKRVRLFDIVGKTVVNGVLRHKRRHGGGCQNTGGQPEMPAADNMPGKLRHAVVVAGHCLAMGRADRQGQQQKRQHRQRQGKRKCHAEGGNIAQVMGRRHTGKIHAGKADDGGQAGDGNRP